MKEDSILKVKNIISGYGTSNVITILALILKNLQFLQSVEEMELAKALCLKL